MNPAEPKVLNKLTLELSNQGSYKAGEKIQGCVVLEVNHPIPIISIRVALTAAIFTKGKKSIVSPAQNAKSLYELLSFAAQNTRNSDAPAPRTAKCYMTSNAKLRVSPIAKFPSRSFSLPHEISDIVGDKHMIDDWRAPSMRDSVSAHTSDDMVFTLAVERGEVSDDNGVIREAVERAGVAMGGYAARHVTGRQQAPVYCVSKAKSQLSRGGSPGVKSPLLILSDACLAPRLGCNNDNFKSTPNGGIEEQRRLSDAYLCTLGVSDLASYLMCALCVKNSMEPANLIAKYSGKSTDEVFDSATVLVGSDATPEKKGTLLLDDAAAHRELKDVGATARMITEEEIIREAVPTSAERKQKFQKLWKWWKTISRRPSLMKKLGSSEPSTIGEAKFIEKLRKSLLARLRGKNQKRVLLSEYLVPCGQQKFPFELEVPSFAAGSYASSFAAIRYSVTAVLLHSCNDEESANQLMRQQRLHVQQKKVTRTFPALLNRSEGLAFTCAQKSDSMVSGTLAVPLLNFAQLHCAPITASIRVRVVQSRLPDATMKMLEDPGACATSLTRALRVMGFQVGAVDITLTITNPLIYSIPRHKFQPLVIRADINNRSKRTCEKQIFELVRIETRYENKIKKSVQETVVFRRAVQLVVLPEELRRHTVMNMQLPTTRAFQPSVHVECALCVEYRVRYSLLALAGSMTVIAEVPVAMT